MKADSIYFKGHSCFKNDWAGFDEIKPINVIIGRNNSGKSHLLDLVEALCDGKLFDGEWEYRFGGMLEEEPLKEIFSEWEWKKEVFGGNIIHDRGRHLVGKTVTWEVTTNSENTSQRDISNVKLSDDVSSAYPFEPHDSHAKHLIDAKISTIKELLDKVIVTYPLDGMAFRRLLADRDIKTELPDTKLALSSDGAGATNIIRRFITSEKLPRGVIQDELLAALNSIFGSDGQFSEIQVQVHDEAQEDAIKDHWEVYLGEDTKGLIPLSKSGSGLKTVFLVLLNLLVVPKVEKKEKSQFTFAFEELENNLHPALLRRLFQYLEDYAVNEKATIFLTTHSSIALDLFGVSEHAQIIHVSHDGESARTTTVPTHSNLIRIVSELGARPSDLLQANGLIWVEGPSDRIYLNRWIELYSDGLLREGRDYQCVFYGGALLAQVQFASPEDEAAKLANLFQINHNLIVVCDGDRTTKGSRLKVRVKRIREEVEKIDGAYIWITDAKEIENYLSGSVLEKVPDSVFKKAPDLSSLPDPEKYESWSSYTEKNIKGKTVDKVPLAISSTQYMTKEVMAKRFDWKKQMRQIVERIDSWNGDSTST